MSVKVRVHNEWFQSTKHGVCSCGSNKRSRRKAGADLTVYSWGNYIAAQWRTVDYCCQLCFQSRVLPTLAIHAEPCGCAFQLVPRSGHTLPPWITLEGSGIRCAA